MPRLLKMPTRETLPDGPKRKFVAELHMHYREADRPKLQEIAGATALAPDDKPVRRETVRRILTGQGDATWKNVDLVLRALCHLAGQDPERRRWEYDGYDDDTTCRDHLRKLWHDSIDDEDLDVTPPPRSEPTPPPQPQTGGWGSQQASGFGAPPQRTPADDPWAQAAPGNGKYTEEPPF
ncbi:hypothetical protein [Streptomyces tateyamensis]|uniref:hypothetical protein n=1 Tax=Streptomyces tateyamensis TaxID=565073 RepID=UPI0011B8016C|nr:hypothetical protein [Streptomyces tateyamensis]